MIFLLAGAAIFTACKKNTTSATLTTSQKVQGKWFYVSNTSVEYYNGVATTYNATINAAAYADFRTDGKIYHFDGTTNPDSHDTSAYKVISDNLIVFNRDT